MEYCEFAPGVLLGPFVDRIWTLTGVAAELEGAAQPVLPDGRPELVIHFGDPFERLGSVGEATRQAGVLLAGQLTAQLTLRPTGRIAVLGVRFHAYGASAFVRIPQHQLAGLTIGIDDVAPSLARAIAHVQAQTASVREAVPLVERALERCLEPRPTDPHVRFVTSRILRSAGVVSIDALAGEASISRRHLERRFLDLVGITPKRLARITRFQSALRVLEEADPARRGTVTAASCGYADQSHFIREFKELAGCSPAQHVVRQGELTGFFVTGNCGSSQRD